LYHQEIQDFHTIESHIGERISGKIREKERVVSMEKKRNRALGRPKGRQEDNTKICLKEIG
jgi:hypothetical protein